MIENEKITMKKGFISYYVKDIKFDSQQQLPKTIPFIQIFAKFM